MLTKPINQTQSRFKRLGRKDEPYDLALSRWYAEYADPVTFLGFFDPRRGPANPNQSTNDSYFDQPRYTRRLAAAERLSPPERYVAYGRLESVRGSSVRN